MNEPYKFRTASLVGILLVAAMTRLIPHPANFSPIAAIALFGGAHFNKRLWAFIVPLSAMLLSDLILGLHVHLTSVYLSFAAIVGIGIWLKSRKSAATILGASVASSILFYAVTNFSEWAIATPNLYPRTWAGLVECYVAAIPFLRNTMIGDLFFSGVMFGTFAWMDRKLWMPKASRSDALVST